MLTIESFFEIKLGATTDDRFAMRNKLREHRLNRERLRNTVHERDEIVMECFFKLRVLVERI